jgi:hypothetical protein
LTLSYERRGEGKKDLTERNEKGSSDFFFSISFFQKPRKGGGSRREEEKEVYESD